MWTVVNRGMPTGWGEESGRSHRMQGSGEGQGNTAQNPVLPHKSASLLWLHENVLCDWDLVTVLGVYKAHFKLRALSHLVIKDNLFKHRWTPCSAHDKTYKGKIVRPLQEWELENLMFFSQPDLVHELFLVGNGACICGMTGLLVMEWVCLNVSRKYNRKS